MSQIFISYASEDRERAKALAQVLEQRGFSVWWDRKIPFGKAYDEVIAESLAQAKCVLVLWTDMSVDSRWVRSEASDAAAREVLIPVLMERDVKIPLEFKLLQAADLCDWQSDPEYPELKALIAQIETMLAHATTATSEQMTPPRGDDLTGATARQSQSAEGGRTSQRGAAGQEDAKPARKKKIIHLFGFIVIPSVAIVLAAALAMTWRLPTRLQLDLVVERVTFTLGGSQAVDLPPSALSFTLLSIENFDRAVFRPERLRVNDDASTGSGSGAPNWRDVSARGEIVLNGMGDERPLLIVERAGDSTGAQPAGRLQPLSGKPHTRVTLETKSGSSPRLVLRMDGQELQTNVLPDGDLDISASHATIEGAGDVASSEGDVSLRVALPEDAPHVQVQGARRFFVVTAALGTPGSTPLLSKAEVQEVEFLKQGAGGSIESALVGKGAVSYPSQPSIEGKTLAAGDSVGVGELKEAFITRLELRPDRAGMDLRFDGVAGRAQVSSGGVKQDLRVTAFDTLWHNAQAAVLVSIAAWALAVCTGAYRLYRDFAAA